jgi:putative spermidine/putrescine transport system permease protein
LERAEGLTSSSTDAGEAARPPRLGRALSRRFRSRRLALTTVLGPPLLWMLVVYIGSLVLLVIAAMFKLDPKSQKPSNEWTLDNLRNAFTEWSVIRVMLRTALIAGSVTVLCFAIALPMAFFIAKVVPAWARRGLIVSILLPLWAGYLVKGYAWRAMLSPAGNRFAAEGSGDGGFMASVLGWTPGYGRVAVVLALTYLWLPYMVLPIYTGIERLPASMLDAAGDLGARPFRTFRSVVMPLLLPSIAAGSIFTFSLSLGDYIVPQLVTDGKRREMFGTFINSTLGAPNQPLAAAYTLWPLIIIILYLMAMKRLGAFESV